MDRNANWLKRPHWIQTSLSARRAWIEIRDPARGNSDTIVALRKESVDRNKPIACVGSDPNGRSPQGERG